VIFVAVITVFFMAAALLVRACSKIVAGPTDTVPGLTTNEDEEGPPL
jgi:tRNA A37 threonylcarbamoyladenosine synthetase subunit TsaC/SUA5/YrdC